MTSSAFSLSSLYPASAFTLLEGSPVMGGMKAGTRHHFCPDCLSWVYTIPEGMDEYINIRSALLEDFSGHAPYAAFYLDEGLPGTANTISSGAIQSFPMAPDYDGFMQLVQEFEEYQA